MDVEAINPFINSTFNFFNTMVDSAPVRGKIFVAGTDELEPTDVSAVIGIAGDYNGWVAIRFKKQTALGVVARMIGEEKSYIDADVRDAIGEVVNIIAGSAKGEIAEKGINYTIALPTVVVGDNHQLGHSSRTRCIVIPFTSEFGNFSVDVCLEK